MLVGGTNCNRGLKRMMCEKMVLVGAIKRLGLISWSDLLILGEFFENLLKGIFIIEVC